MRYLSSRFLWKVILCYFQPHFTSGTFISCVMFVMLCQMWLVLFMQQRISLMLMRITNCVLQLRLRSLLNRHTTTYMILYCDWCCGYAATISLMLMRITNYDLQLRPHSFYWNVTRQLTFCICENRHIIDYKIKSEIIWRSQKYLFIY